MTIGPNARGLETIPVVLIARQLGWGGGIERDVSKFARHLPQYGIAPHIVSFTAGGARWSEIEAAGIPMLSLSVTSFKSRSCLKGAWQLRCYIQKHNIQVVHAFDAAANMFAVPLARLVGVPVALTSHLWCRDVLPFHTQVLLATVDLFASGLFVNCHAVADDLSANWHVAPRRIHVCHNGYETQEFDDHNRVRPLTLQGASFVVGIVAVLREEKNIRLLIEAFPEVLRVDPLARLLIVGDGPLRAALEQQARDLNIMAACVFQGATPNPADWMRAMDVFVLPSKSEAFSNALLEAMACGCCPVASRVGGTSELVCHGQTGLLFDSDNAAQLAESLCVLATDPSYRKEMAAAAARSVREKFTIETAASCLASIYRQLVTQHDDQKLVHREMEGYRQNDCGSDCQTR